MRYKKKLGISFGLERRWQSQGARFTGDLGIRVQSFLETVSYKKTYHLYSGFAGDLGIGV